MPLDSNSIIANSRRAYYAPLDFENVNGRKLIKIDFPPGARRTKKKKQNAHAARRIKCLHARGISWLYRQRVRNAKYDGE